MEDKAATAAAAGADSLVTLEGKIYSCKQCHTHLALSQDIVSKCFYWKDGKAYLFRKVVNVSVGEKEERELLSGLHVIAVLHCMNCGVELGWKYESVQQEDHKYKEGKFIIGRSVVQWPEELDCEKETQDDADNAAVLVRLLDAFQKQFKEVQKTLAAHEDLMETKFSDLTSQVRQLKAKLDEYEAKQNVVAPSV